MAIILCKYFLQYISEILLFKLMQGYALYILVQTIKKDLDTPMGVICICEGFAAG